MVTTVVSSQVVRLKNTTNKVQPAWLEPLGDEFALQPGVLYELTARDDFGKVEIDLGDDGFVVHGWVTRIASIDENGTANIQWKLPD